MPTPILTLPLVDLVVTTGTNEDWLDSLQFVDESSPPLPVDITGISFNMEIRHLTADNEVLITASTSDGRLSIGGNENSYLSIWVPVEFMNKVPPQDYVGDIVATADGYTRVIARLVMAVVQGVTR